MADPHGGAEMRCVSNRTQTFLRSAAAILMAVTLSGCVPHFYWYRYLSLEDAPDVVILERGRLEFSDLFFDSEMPLKYELKRESYVLSFKVWEDYFWPNLIISAHDDRGVPLRVQVDWERTSKGCGGNKAFDLEKGRITVASETDPARPHATLYSWTWCDFEGQPDSGTLAIRVLRIDGAAVGEESVPFAVKINGVRLEIDAP